MSVRNLIRMVCLAVLLTTAGQVQAGFVNGSFETGDFSGWTLVEGGASTDAGLGIWGNVSTGTTITTSTPVFDHFDGASYTSRSPGLPRTYSATDGTRLAIQLQNGPQFHRMYQDILLGASDTTLTWDMFYQDHNRSFVVNSNPNEIGQYLAISLRDTSDNLLSTLFITNPGDAGSIPMTSFSRDITGFAGSLVRLSVEMDVDVFYLDAGFDNFGIQSSVVPEPASMVIWGIGALGMGLVARRRKKKVATV